MITMFEECIISHNSNNHSEMEMGVSSDRQDRGWDYNPADVHRIGNELQNRMLISWSQNLEGRISFKVQIDPKTRSFHQTSSGEHLAPTKADFLKKPFHQE